MSIKTHLTTIRSGNETEIISGYKNLCKWLERNKPTSRTEIDNLIQTLSQHLKSEAAPIRISVIKNSAYLFKQTTTFDGSFFLNFVLFFRLVYVSI